VPFLFRPAVFNLAEPPPTGFDLRFRLWDIPVRVHPFFWLAALILFSPYLGAPSAPMLLAIWVAIFFFSILIHELGHAVVMKHYGDHPSIVLYAFGGLAIPSGSGFGDFYDAGWRPRAKLNPIRKIQISFAGPLAGFIVAFVAILIARTFGVKIWFEMFGYFPEIQVEGVESFPLLFLLHQLVWINVFWGLINLLPVYPLDGGQISRELFVLSGAYDGIRKSLYLSMFVAIGAALFGWQMLGSLWMGIMFASLAFSSWQSIQQISRF
jgi:Zn-dependent protease